MTIRRRPIPIRLALPLLAAIALAPAAAGAAPESGSPAGEADSTLRVAAWPVRPPPAAAADLTPAEGSAPARDPRIPNEWLGRYCTPLGCKGREANPLMSGVGFGAAIIAGSWLARRRTSPAR